VVEADQAIGHARDERGLLFMSRTVQSPGIAWRVKYSECAKENGECYNGFFYQAI
jgi:hypothetical protein